MSLASYWKRRKQLGLAVNVGPVVLHIKPSTRVSKNSMRFISGTPPIAVFKNVAFIEDDDYVRLAIHKVKPK